MKCNIKLATYIAIVVGINACTLEDFDPDEWAIDPELEISTSYSVFSSATATQTAYISTNYSSFTFSVDDDWCHVTQDADTLFISVDPNETVEQRATNIRITISRGTKSLYKDIAVVQFGGVWDTIGEFNVYWQYEVGDGQRSAIEEILENMVYVEGGTFIMGTGDDEHTVTLSSFYISKYELTQNQWCAVMGENPSVFRGSDLPVESISWADALDYVTKLSTLTNLSFALPTEAQWEYAARGGKYSLDYVYPGSDDYTEVAHFYGSTLLSEDDPLYTTVEGGTLKANELGLYDMAGNVAEFCYDWYDSEYDMTQNEDPTGVETGTYKVVRGGAFNSLYGLLSSYYRFYVVSTTYVTNWYTGVRLIINL